MEEEGWCNTGYESKTFRWFRGEVTVHKNKSKNYYKYVTQTIIKFKNLMSLLWGRERITGHDGRILTLVVGLKLYA